MSWLGFAGVFALFFATHSIPVRPAIKARISAVIGARGFSMAYSILSIAMLALLIRAAGQAPYVELWPQAGWQRHVVHLGMLTVCILLAFTLGRPNPFSFGGARNDRFDPARPGIVRLVRHPVLAVLLLWALVHMLVNGDLAHVLMFGVLGAFAYLGRSLINRRKQRQMGQDRWQDLNAAVASAPLLQRPASLPGACLRLLCGVAAFAALAMLHPVVIGVAVW
ncbi:MAG: NnrU family protein [Pseudomonadota bacterium]